MPNNFETNDKAAPRIIGGMVAAIGSLVYVTHRTRANALQILRELDGVMETSTHEQLMSDVEGWKLLGIQQQISDALAVCGRSCAHLLSPSRVEALQGIDRYSTTCVAFCVSAILGVGYYQLKIGKELPF